MTKKGGGQSAINPVLVKKGEKRATLQSSE